MSFFKPDKVALLKRTEEENIAFLFRTKNNKLSILWKSPPNDIEVPKSISRKFIRDNFSSSSDISDVLFSIGRDENLKQVIPFRLVLSKIYNKYWVDICEEVIGGSIELVGVRDIFKK